MMLKKFIIKSYQVKNKKWIPAVDLIESGGDFGIRITDEVSFRDKEFESKEDADKFITNYFIKRGYTNV